MHGDDFPKVPVRADSLTTLTSTDFPHFKNWFDSYVGTFASDDPAIQTNIDLKYQHTQRVCRAAVNIGKDLGLDERNLCLAEIAALFHDVGRFEQFKRYRTFSDKRSINHAAFGVEILRDKSVLSHLDKSEQNLIIGSILLHNRAILADDGDDRSLLHSRLLRDADKLDIWWVVTDYYRQKAAGVNNEGLELDLADTPGISPEVYKNIINGKTILFDSLKNLNDFKLLQVGWVYDINFLPTLRRLKERGYLKMLQSFLPDSEEVRDIFTAVFHHIDSRLKEG